VAEEEAWNSYFYPGTDIFINKLGLRDNRLWEAERFLVARRTAQLHADLSQIPTTLDLDQLRAIHKYIAGDLYEWAGEMRTTTIGKHVEEGDPTRWFLSPSAIPVWMDAVADQARAIDWPNLTRADFVREVADLHTMVNFCHPFRELNGRTSRLFLHQVAAQTPFQLDFDRVDQVEWNVASRDSIHPGLTRPAGGPLAYDPGHAVFEKIVVDRGTPSADAADRTATRIASLDAAVSRAVALARVDHGGRQVYSPQPTTQPPAGAQRYIPASRHRSAGTALER
jgi:cell filamentation protein